MFMFRLLLAATQETREPTRETRGVGHLSRQVAHGSRPHAAEVPAQRPQGLRRQCPRERDGHAARSIVAHGGPSFQPSAGHCGTGRPDSRSEAVVPWRPVYISG